MNGEAVASIDNESNTMDVQIESNSDQTGSKA